MTPTLTPGGDFARSSHSILKRANIPRPGSHKSDRPSSRGSNRSKDQNTPHGAAGSLTDLKLNEESVKRLRRREQLDELVEQLNKQCPPSCTHPAVRDDGDDDDVIIQFPQHSKELLVAIFGEMESFHFNTILCQERTDGHALYYVGCFLLHRMDLVRKFHLDWHGIKLFMLEIESGYRSKSMMITILLLENPYHNSIHAADVSISVYHMLTRCVPLLSTVMDIEGS